MPTYLLDVPHNTPLYEIMRSWNGGWEKDRVRAELKRRYGEGHDQLLEQTWSGLEAELGDACIPVTRGKTPEDYLRKLEAETCPMRRGQLKAYLDWKGITGPGAQLRSILADQGAQA